jgi:uncharacterized membrane protein YkvA (DUF1232 family)
MLARLKIWASTIRRDVLALYLVGRDPRVPWYVKALAVATAAYALSPIDLIPDFIPVLGYLDDLVILPLAILLVVRLVAPEVMADLRMQAERRLMTDRPRNTAGAVFIVLLWLTSAAAAFVLSR